MGGQCDVDGASPVRVECLPSRQDDQGAGCSNEARFRQVLTERVAKLLGSE